MHRHENVDDNAFSNLSNTGKQKNVQVELLKDTTLKTLAAQFQISDRLHGMNGITGKGELPPFLQSSFNILLCCAIKS